PEESLAELPDNLAFFEMSPDGKRLVVPGDDGEVFIVEWEAGDVGVVRGEKMDQLRTVPVWRGNEELCYVGVSGDGESESGKVSNGLVLWRDNEERVISGRWGEKVREGFLDDDG
ncbi:MAG: hypothetical protein P8J87_19970, partial [Verrucomicrobiales bacterium]|nr:hypothetical protein [Verrucomicrobiales bacterium]